VKLYDTENLSDLNRKCPAVVFRLGETGTAVSVERKTWDGGAIEKVPQSLLYLRNRK
jgi:hypothetical protein